MALTSPSNLFSPDAGDGYALVTDLAAMQDSVQTALNTRVRTSTDYLWANAAARTAQTGMVAGQKGYQTDTGITYRRNASTWKEWESDWITYTPTLTLFVIGTGGAAANTASYKYEHGRVRVRGVAKLGTTGRSVSGFVMTLPVTARALRSPWQFYPGTATLLSAAGNVNYFANLAADNASVTTVTPLSPGTSGMRVGVNGSAPFTWTSGDAVDYDFTFDPA